MAINNKRIEEWFDLAIKKHADVMMPFMKMCAEQGFVDLLHENIDYFKIDLCCEMLNLMKKDGIHQSCYNVSFKFDHKIDSEMKIFTKEALIKANRVLYQRLHLLKKIRYK